MEEEKKPLSRSSIAQGENEYRVEKDQRKKARHGSCLTGLDLKLDRPLKELDPEKLKNEIRRWARTVVRYARQLSRNLSGRRSSSSSFKENIAAASSSPH